MTRNYPTDTYLLLLLATVLIRPGLAGEFSPDTIRISGEIVDQSGTPIAGAVVTLIAATDRDRALFAELNPRRDWIDTETTDAGHFELGFQRTDRRFLTAGDSLVMVRADGFELQVVDVPIARILSLAPLQFQLRRSSDVEMEVRSADGNAIAGVAVFPAATNGQRIPWCVAKELPPTMTGSSGRVSVVGVSPESLDGIFAISPSIGHQRLTVRRSESGDLFAVATATRDVEGQIKQKSGEPIPGIADTEVFAITDPPATNSFWYLPLQCTWAVAPVSASGTFLFNALGLGEIQYKISCPAGFPFRAPHQSENDVLAAAAEPYRWELEYVQQVKLRATVIEANSETPLADIQILARDNRLEPTFTAADGKAEFFRVFDHVSYYPKDGLREFFCADAFYRGSKKIPIEGEIELEPIELYRSPQWRGKIVDEDGDGVVAAKVNYEFGEERFNRTETTFSGPDGSFRLYEVPQRTALNLRAIKNTDASESISMVMPPGEEVTLRLSPRKAFKPTGRVVDLQGRGVAGVSVAIYVGRVIIKESYRAEEMGAVDLYESARTVRTGVNGTFEFPATINFSNRLQIQIRDPSFFSYFSPFIDGATVAETSDSDLLDLGDFPVMRRPTSRHLNMTVGSALGEPIAGAQWVIVGARTGTVRGTTNKSGHSPVTVADGRAIFAVSADGYHVHFAELPGTSESLRVTLHDDDKALNPDEADSIRDVPDKQFIDAAMEIFSAMQPPDPKANTLHRVRTYYEALASINPQEFVRVVTSAVSTDPQLGQAALSAVDRVLARQPEIIELIIENKLIPAENAYASLVRAAASTDDPELREEWLGEALVSVRAISGTQGLYAAAFLAEVFLLSGRTDLAKQIIEDAWSQAPQLQEIVDSGERKMLIGESRTIAPMLAILDLEKSRKLIRLTAREVEMPNLLTEARLFRAEAYPDEFIQEFRGASGAEFVAGGANVRSRSLYSDLVGSGLPIPDEIAAAIDNPDARLRFLLLHARLTDDDNLRRDLLTQAVDTVRAMESNRGSDFFRFHYTGVMQEEVRRFESIDQRSLDALIFATLWNLPKAFETDRLQTIVGVAAQIVALRDRGLGRVLLEPAMKDRGWLFMGHQSSLDRNETLMSAARVDPKWAADLVEQICESELQHDPSDQLELRAGMVTALISAMDE